LTFAAGVVVGGVTVASVVVGLTTTGGIVVVVSSWLDTATAVPAAAAPAPAMPMTAAVPMPPPTNPAGRAGKTATAALLTKGATGASFLHSWADRTTIGAYSEVRAGSNVLFCAST
jgi:hypothetical protein